jgi:4-carboxymuconolactone decarboxylase
MKHKIPSHYQRVKKDYPSYMKAIERMGEALRKNGPLDEKISQLIQLAASVSIRSEGATHSHVRRALEAGARPEEIRQTVLLLTATIGFPHTMAGLSWVNDILDKT